MYVEGTYQGPRWPSIIAYLVFSLFLIPFCFSQNFFFFKFQMTCVCVSMRRCVHLHALGNQRKAPDPLPGAGAEGSCELNTWDGY